MAEKPKNTPKTGTKAVAKKAPPKKSPTSKPGADIKPKLG